MNSQLDFSEILFGTTSHSYSKSWQTGQGLVSVFDALWHLSPK